MKAVKLVKTLPTSDELQVAKCPGDWPAIVRDLKQGEVSPSGFQQMTEAAFASHIALQKPAYDTWLKDVWEKRPIPVPADERLPLQKFLETFQSFSRESQLGILQELCQIIGSKTSFPEEIQLLIASLQK